MMDARVKPGHDDLMCEAEPPLDQSMLP
jgi:hypothetical protein